MANHRLGELKQTATSSLREQFERVEILVRAIAEDKHPGLILCGGPGLGKTHTVRSVLKQAGIEPVVTTANNEHALVFTLRQNQCAPVFLLDDTDSLAGRPACLNVVKGAFGPDHEVVWDSREAQKSFGHGLRFKIKGRLIWISNRNYTNAETRRNELQDHWGALASRGIRPLFIDTSDQIDLFKYIVYLACTSPRLWQGNQPLNKATSEKVVRFFIDRRNYLLELSPRTLSHIIGIFRATDQIAERNVLLKELLAPKSVRELPAIPYPTIIGKGQWRDVPV